jgi:hypothetical protein
VVAFVQPIAAVTSRPKKQITIPIPRQGKLPAMYPKASKGDFVGVGLFVEVGSDSDMIEI